MKELSFEKMEGFKGGDCFSQIAGGVPLIWGLAIMAGPIGWVVWGAGALLYAYLSYQEGGVC